MEKSLRKRSPVTAQIGTHLNWRLQGMTILLMLFCAYRLEPGMSVLLENQQAADRDRYRYLTPKQWTDIGDP